MGNDPSKRSATGTHDEDDDADGPVRIGGQRKKNMTEEAAAAESEHATLGGHTPYHAALSALSPPPPPVSSDSGGGGGGGNGRAPQSFSEDRHSDAAYASLDDGSSLTGGSTPVTPATSSADGPVSIGGGKKRIEGDIVQVSRAVDDSASLLHPEVEALLSFAQFYPQDAGLATVAAPQGALNITPVLMRPRAVMDVYAALAQRWSGVGASAARAQVLVGKEMDKLEASVQQVLPAVMERQAQIKALNQELAQLPDLHASLQRQQIAVAQCVRTMQELNNLLPVFARLEDLDEILEWQEAKHDDDDDEDEEEEQGDADAAPAQLPAAS